MAATANPLAARYRQQGLPPDQAAFNPYADYQDPGDGSGFDPAPANFSMGAAAPTSIYGDPSATKIPGLNPDTEAPIHKMFYDDQQRIAAGGDQLNNEAQSQLKYYDPLQRQYQGQADQALQDLKKTPGYTPQEASQINVDYGRNKTGADDLGKRFLTPDEQSAIAGDPNQARDIAFKGTDAEGKMLNSYGENLSGQVGNYANYTGGAVNDLKSGLSGAVGKLDSGLQGAQGKFSKLDAAVSNPGLEFDPNHTENQLTDADVQAMKTAAGVRVGNQYRSAQDDLQRRAAAAGNTSPLAIAAARARLEHQSAADAGDAEANADIAARQAQYQRAAGIEGQREGAVNTQTGYRAGAATTEQKQAQDAAALAGTTGVGAAGLAGTQEIGAAEKVGQAGIDAANAYGQKAIDTRTRMTDQEVNATGTAEQQAAARAAGLAGNRQATQTDVGNTGYQQGMATDQATSQGAQAVGNARQAGEGAYRAGVTGQQGMAQQGGQAAMGQQQAAYSTQTGGINSSTANRANYETGGTGNSALNQATKVLGTVLGHKDGYVATEPEVATIAEGGPEVVVPLTGRYRNRGRMAA